MKLQLSVAYIVVDKICSGIFQLGVLEEGVSEGTAETTAIIERVNLRFHGYWVQVNGERGDPPMGSGDTRVLVVNRGSALPDLYAVRQYKVGGGIYESEGRRERVCDSIARGEDVARALQRAVRARESASERWVALKDAEAVLARSVALLECVKAQRSRGVVRKSILGGNASRKRLVRGWAVTGNRPEPTRSAGGHEFAQSRRLTALIAAATRGRGDRDDQVPHMDRVRVQETAYSPEGDGKGSSVELAVGELRIREVEWQTGENGSRVLLKQRKSGRRSERRRPQRVLESNTERRGPTTKGASFPSRFDSTASLLWEDSVAVADQIDQSVYGQYSRRQTGYQSKHGSQSDPASEAFGR
ncbi:hypothetical protein B0H17DRAFT_1123571 [Mycena rosella]|uniref:Uncharacterized protein n=1 Tax=Mycena rosella TaxID=1033263 RepID=A0AAD7H2I2_MYCRO|nr:hypothetical protein B0H17DRAFT_1123571 [Mycena rosella]